ncbi:SRPBCC domain-containing protein [Chloroflexi bacterium TSY]|nr:SRPBCC domain-containing protein [Chloroflexi bacterium TSY]
MSEHIPPTGCAIQTKSTFRKECAVAINIHAQLERIWSLLTTAEDFPNWNSTVSSIEGRIALGEKIKLSVPYAPGRVFNLTVKEFVPNQRMVWSDGMVPMFKGVRTYRLTPKSDGSTDFSMVEVLRGVMLPMIGGSLPDFGPPFEQYATDLKQEAERGN